MADVDNDFHDYENTRDDEGGLHTGRSVPSRGLVIAAAAAVGLLVVGVLVLVLIG